MDKEGRKEFLTKFLGYIGEENVPLINQSFGDLEICMNDIGTELTKVKVDALGIKQKLNDLSISELQLKNEMSQFRSAKSSAKTVGANVRDYPK